MLVLLSGILFDSRGRKRPVRWSRIGCTIKYSVYLREEGRRRGGAPGRLIPISGCFSEDILYMIVEWGFTSRERELADWGSRRRPRWKTLLFHIKLHPITYI